MQTGAESPQRSHQRHDSADWALDGQPGWAKDYELRNLIVTAIVRVVSSRLAGWRYTAAAPLGSDSSGEHPIRARFGQRPEPNDSLTLGPSLRAAWRRREARSR